MFGFLILAKCNGRPASPLIRGWGWLEGSVYVEVDSNVDVDIEVDILTPTLVIPDLAKCHGHPVSA